MFALFVVEGVAPFALDLVVFRLCAGGGVGGGGGGAGVCHEFLDEALVFGPRLGGAVEAEVDLPAVDDDEGQILRLVVSVLGGLGGSAGHGGHLGVRKVVPGTTDFGLPGRAPDRREVS